MNVEYATTFLRDVKKIKEKPLSRRVQAVIEQVESAKDLQEVAGVIRMQGAPNY